MKTVAFLLIGLMFFSCQTAETIVSSPYKLNEAKSTVYSAKTFMFKNYYFTYKDGEATLVYQQDPLLNGSTKPVYLTLQEEKNDSKYQEFTDSSKQITVKIIDKNEVRLQINKTRHTLYTPNHLEDINADTAKILADIAIWREARY